MICLLCNHTFHEREKFYKLLMLIVEKQPICDTCQQLFEKIEKDYCPACYRSNHSGRCADCENWSKLGHKVQHRALYTYNGAMKEYFSKYKFQGDYQLRKIFASELKIVLKKFYKGYQVIPVPISQKRFQERQFNQVTAVLDAGGISYQDILDRDNQKSQSSKNRFDRLSNKSPFYLKKIQNMPKKIVVIDDIYATGATLQGICKLLYENDVVDVKTVSVAR